MLLTQKLIGPDSGFSMQDLQHIDYTYCCGTNEESRHSDIRPTVQHLKKFIGKADSKASQTCNP
jgi:hypothetical protein